MKNKKILLACLLSTALVLPSISYADDSASRTVVKNSAAEKSAIDERVSKEKQRNEFLVSFYRPTYILPFYYSSSPARAVYQNDTPGNQTINPYEVKFQISFKVPVWQNIFNKSSILYLAYTQLSYWQAYNRSAFFRESNYEPEIFVANKLDWQLGDGWKVNFLNVGLNHQSNGRGAEQERSWNRAYVEGIVGKENLMLSLKAWYPMRQGADSANPNITDYLGYERLLVSYKYHEQVFSVEARNTVESSFSKSATELTWSFPLTKHINGYVQVFSGYGQSLIEYDHYSNSAGVGIALNNWI